MSNRKNPLAGRMQGERDGEVVGERIEKGLRTDPGKAKKFVADQQQKREWENNIEELKRKDEQEAEKEIKKTTQFLKEVAEEEKERQRVMRERVEKIANKKLKGQSTKSKTGEAEGEEGIEDLKVPEGRKRGSFLQGLKKKGKGALTEARGAIARGGG